MPETPVEVIENPELAEAEFTPTPDQQRAVASGCLANALAGITGLTTAEKNQLRTEVAALEANLSTAIQMVKNKQARLSLQKQRLADERASIGESQSNFSKFYAVAAKAIAACDDAAKAAQDAKSGVDMVFSRETEIKYREGLLSTLEVKLAAQLDELNASIEVLDMMVLAIQ